MHPESPIAKGLDLRRGDRVIAVNGQPIGDGPRAGMKMFESLKNEGRFVVLIERNGERVTLTYGTGE